LDVAFTSGVGTRATVVAQAAERFYRNVPGGAPSLVRNVLTLAQGSALEWLPQETILFDRCALDRRLDIDLSDDAWFLGVETVVFGRAAMGETVATAWLRDTISIQRGGRLLWQDTTRMDGAVAEALSRPAVAAGARAMATIIHAAPGAADRLEAVRAASGDAEAGASTWDGLLIARILAPESATLRQAVIATLACLRADRPLPRLWNC
jgi:urease accessory protein